MALHAMASWVDVPAGSDFTIYNCARAYLLSRPRQCQRLLRLTCPLRALTL